MIRIIKRCVGALLPAAAMLLPGAVWAQCTNCTITTVGSDTVLTFTADGTFTPPADIAVVQYLVVGGGGGGGGVSAAGNLGGAGGGGAGGYRAATGFGVTPLTVYNITVGAGGTVGVGGTSQGGTGGSSIFSTITATGGGGGASSAVNNNGVNGASGGGGRVTGTGGTGTAGQGNNGGDGGNAGGGGGGSAAVGADGGAATGGAGGTGTVNNITGANVTYAAGGAGGNYGTRAAGTAGAANLGNGGTGAAGANGGAAFSGGAGGSGIVIIRYSPPPAPVAYYDMDEVSWGTILDSSGNGNDAAAVGSAAATDYPPPAPPDSATPGSPGTCGAGSIPATAGTQAVDTGIDLNNLGNAGTISFWYSSNADWDDGTDRMLFDASNNLGNGNADKHFYLLKNGNGSLRFSVEDSNDNADEAQSANQNFAADTWHHVAVTWDINGDDLRLYLDGALADTSGATANSLGNVATLYFGDQRMGGIQGTLGDYTANSANGYIDEVRIYDSVLSAAYIQADMNDTHPCDIIDHFNINIGGAAASTCNPKSITITAQDASDATVTNYTGTVNITTAVPTHGDWAQPAVTGTLTNGTADDGAASYTFVAADNGVKILELTNVHADDLTITVVDNALASTSTTSVTINFRDNVFVITNDTLQIAGRNQAMSVAMWRRDPGTGDCSIATGYTGAKNLDAWLTPDINDPGGAAPTIGALSLPNAAPAVNPASNNLALTFTNGTANFNLGTTDVGKYVLNMRDDTRGFASAVDISGSSSSITTRPFALVISGITQGATTNPSGSAAGDALFGIAGVNFDTTVGAYRYSAAADSNNDGAPDGTANLANTTAGGLAASYATTLTLSPSAAGFTPATGAVGTLSNATFNGFSGGAQTKTNLQYSEVGSFVFDTSSPLVTDYLGTSGANLSGTYFNSSNTQTNATRVGRFRPNDFVLSAGDINNRVDLACASSFTYLGEVLRLEFTLTARNGQGATTVNYTTASGFAKLDPATIASLNIGAIDGVTTPLSTRITTDTSSGAFANGVANVFARVSLNRVAAVDGPYTNAQFGIAPTDSDGTAMNTLDINVDNIGGTDHKLVDTTILRYGRLFLESAFGSELLPLTIPIYAEFYNGSQFVLNTNDSCTDYNSADAPDLPILPFANRTGLTADPARTGAGTLINGRYDPANPVQLDSSDEIGSINMNFGVPPYLHYDWSTDGNLDGTEDDDPNSKATFGIFGGPEDNQIYIREVY